MPEKKPISMETMYMKKAEYSIGVKTDHGQVEIKVSFMITLGKIALVLAILYVFLISIGLMGAGFKIFGKEFAKALIETTNNPFVGLFIGVLATALIQSSSTTTSMVVAFVAAGTLTIQNAIPVIMGANIGTAVTSTLVSLGHVSRQYEFRRAFAAGTVHDIFNLLTVIIFLPLELMTGFLSRSAGFLSTILAGSTGMEFKSPLKLATKPIIKLITSGIGSFEQTKLITGIIVVLLGVLLLFGSLYFLSNLLKQLIVSKSQRILQLALEKSGYLAILIGVVLTVMVQSSSVTTSLMIPLAAAGIISINQVFPVALGANLGTTVTALLASLATGRPEALTIALVHLLFNICGILVFYPFSFIRAIPIKAAEVLAEKATEKRIYAVLFILIVFFVIPGIAVFST